MLWFDLVLDDEVLYFFYWYIQQVMDEQWIYWVGIQFVQLYLFEVGICVVEDVEGVVWQFGGYFFQVEIKVDFVLVFFGWVEEVFYYCYQLQWVIKQVCFFFLFVLGVGGGIFVGVQGVVGQEEKWFGGIGFVCLYEQFVVMDIQQGDLDIEFQVFEWQVDIGYVWQFDILFFLYVYFKRG